MHYMILPLRRYFDFRGRSRRREYWLFLLALIIGAVLVALVEVTLGLGETRSSTSRYAASFNYDNGPLLSLYWLAIIIPSIAVQVRRFHDQDKSGWWVLLNLFPFFGGFAVLIFMLMEGTRGPNRFGPDPKDGGEEDLRETFG